MEVDRKRIDVGGLAVGLFLVAFGSLWLLDRYDLVAVDRLWQWWPLIIVYFGAVHLIRGDEKGRHGIWLLMIGLWLLVSSLGLFGLDWGESWPLVLVAIGASLIWDALFNRSWA